MDEVRAPADKLEGLVGKKFWPFPTYSDILFYSLRNRTKLTFVNIYTMACIFPFF